MPVARLRPISSHVAAVDLHGHFQVAVFLVRHPGGLLAIDAGFPGWGYAVLTAARSLPEPNEITHLILTHAHSDHIGGAAEILAGSDPEILCSTAERTFIEEGRSLALAARTPLSWAVLGLNHLFLRRRISPLRIDGALDDDEHILGLRVISVPGHTPGQIALLHEQDGVVLSADSVFNVRGHLGHDPTPGLTIDIRQAEASLERLLELGLEDFAPSHGPAMLGDATSRLRRFLDERKAGEG